MLNAYPDELAAAVGDELKRQGHKWRGRMLQRMRAPLPPPGQRNPNRTLHTRTGRLRGSLRVETGGSDLSSLHMTLASRGVPYASSQEHGAVIVPVTRKWLTEPLRAAMTPAGVTRKSAARYFQEDPKNTFVLALSNRSGSADRLYIVRRRFKQKGGRKSQLEFLFRLRRRSVIPGPATTGEKSRFGFFDTWNNASRERAVGFSSAILRAARSARAKSGGAQR